jgi:SAM-dependent methyltransferase
MLRDDTEARARAYYDAIAERYDEMLDAPGNRAARACFWQHVEAALPERAHILDFGAGSGLDAEHFAGRGHKVVAYDISEGMIAMLRRRCAAQLAAGTVEAFAGTLENSYGELAARAPYDAIVADFAVLSSIGSLAPLFHALARLLAPGGSLLAAIQNPWNPRDLRTPGFWRALAARAWRGGMRYRGANGTTIFHHTPGQVRRAAQPWFEQDRRPAPPCHASCFGPASPFRVVALRRR